MKILTIISEAPPVKSGIARVAEKLSQGFSSHGFDMDILSLPDIPRVELGEFRFSSMPLRLHQLKDRFSSYDVIHLHGPVPTFSDSFLIWGLRGLDGKRPRLLYTHHAPIELKHWGLRPFIKAYNYIQERMSNIADHVVVSTPAYGHRLGKYIDRGKLSVIPWGVDFDQYYAPPEKDGSFTVVFLGQMRPYKGLPILLQAVQDIENIRIWVIGDGHSADEYRKLAAFLNIADITFWGRLDDQEMISLLKQAHVIVLPSVTRSEAFGIALLEGMAAGLVPVASHLPGVADVVGNEGMTFAPGDVRALNQILVRLRDDPSLRQHLAHLAQAKARLYSWERTVFEYERIICSWYPDEFTLPAFKRNIESHSFSIHQ